MATLNLNAPTWTEGSAQPYVNINTSFNIFDGAIAGNLTKDTSGDGDITLATTGTEPFEWQRAFIKVINTGSIWLSNHSMNIPAEGSFYMVSNENGSSYSLNVQVTGGTGIGALILPNEVALVYCDGTDVRLISNGYDFENHIVTETGAIKVLTAADSGNYYNNTGSIVTTKFTLPTAVNGLAFMFTRTASQVMLLNPVGSDQFRYKAADGLTAGIAGSPICIKTDNSIIGIECKLPGVWEYVFLTGTFADGLLSIGSVAAEQATITATANWSL